VLRRATSLADLLGVDFALINRNRKREANKRLRAAAADAAGVSRTSSFSDLRSGLSTPMTGSFMVDPTAHADPASRIRAEAGLGGPHAFGQQLGVVNASLERLTPSDASEAATPRAGAVEHTLAGHAATSTYSPVANGVSMNEAGEWVTTDEDGHRIVSGGSRGPSKERAGTSAVASDEAETKMEILVGDVDGKVRYTSLPLEPR